jgi:hypothetical protein
MAAGCFPLIRRWPLIGPPLAEGPGAAIPFCIDSGGGWGKPEPRGSAMTLNLESVTWREAWTRMKRCEEAVKQLNDRSARAAWAWWKKECVRPDWLDCLPTATALHRSPRPPATGLSCRAGPSPMWRSRRRHTLTLGACPCQETPQGQISPALWRFSKT